LKELEIVIGLILSYHPTLREYIEIGFWRPLITAGRQSNDFILYDFDPYYLCFRA